MSSPSVYFFLLILLFSESLFLFLSPVISLLQLSIFLYYTFKFTSFPWVHSLKFRLFPRPSSYSSPLSSLPFWELSSPLSRFFIFVSRSSSFCCQSQIFLNYDQFQTPQRRRHLIISLSLPSSLGMLSVLPSHSFIQ